MTIVAIAALALAATTMGLVIWLVPRLIRKVEDDATGDVARGALEAEFERVKGELEALKVEADESHRQAEQLAEELHHALTTTAPGAGLAPTDVSGRLRAFRAYAEARAARRDPVPDPVVPQGSESVAPGRPPSG